MDGKPSELKRKRQDKAFSTSNQRPLLSCSVCSDPISSDEKALLRPCGHYSFHSRCITRWLSEYSTCPYCHDTVTSCNGTAVPIRRHTLPEYRQTGPYSPRNLLSDDSRPTVSSSSSTSVPIPVLSSDMPSRSSSSSISFSSQTSSFLSSSSPSTHPLPTVPLLAQVLNAASLASSYSTSNSSTMSTPNFTTSSLSSTSSTTPSLSPHSTLHYIHHV